ncbi:hypothetical protein ACKWTF_000282 [Chironomus riparius]
MNNQNWLQFQHGGTQYGTPGTANYTPAAQSGYVAAPNYGTTTQRAATGYDQSQYASQTYATSRFPLATAQYEYGYGRPAQTYDTTKTYYQQASASYVNPQYDSNAAPKPVTTYAQPARTTIQQKPTQYSATYASPATSTSAKQQAPNQQTQQQTATTAYSSYDTALYSAVMAQQSNKSANTNQQQGGWPKKGNNFKPRKSVAPKPQQIHYCDVCKISCAGPQTYREHLEGQKHKKREALQKAQQDTATPGTQPATTQRGSNLRCELCDVTCTGNDAYSAHVRGSKHQKVVKLHTKLGKPIPSTEPTPVGTSKDKEGDDEVIGDDVKPVGEEYIEEMKDQEGKVTTFNCKLCDCKFNDPNAKEMHTKGRRHRLQYKKKVQPDLVVDVKPTLRQRKLAEREKQRQQMQEEIWNRRNRMGEVEIDEEDRMYWEERRRFEEENGEWNRNFPMRGRPLMGIPPMFNMMNGRRVETQDDRHVISRHAEVYPKEEELQTIQKIVSHTERALKLVSDAMTIQVQESGKEEKMEVQNDTESTKTNGSNDKKDDNKENGGQNQMITFQKDAEGTVRLLKGVMRVGLLAKGLLLQGDSNVQLVVLCAEKPTSAVLKRVVSELPAQLKKIADDAKYTVTMAPVDGAVIVSDGAINVKVSLTSPLLREQAAADSTTNNESVSNSEDLLPREPCLQALRALRQSKWFQARATGLQSCVMIMRILRDLCQRNPTFTPLSQWAMELLTEKVIASAGVPLSPGDCLRRIMECLSSGFIICGPGLMDPCEKEPVDALNGLSKQQREDITQQAQQFLRFIAFRQIHKVLGMDPLPVQKYQGNRPWKFNTSRKRRRSGTEPSEGDGQKIVKKDGESNVSEAAAEKMN